jgi:hypothetical protein
MTFEKPTKQMAQHLKPLYIKVHIDGRHVNSILVDNGATMNILLVTVLSKLAKTKEDLTPSNMTVNGFTKEATKTRGTISIKVKVGSKVTIDAFFVVNTMSAYNAFLRRD